MTWWRGMVVWGILGLAFGLRPLVAQETAKAAPGAAVESFVNPLLEDGPDPWVFWWKGFYFYSNTTGRNLTLRKTADITDLRGAETKVVWAPEPGQAWSKEVWAPELHRWGKKWYIYFAADAGENSTHRIYVIENANDDPMQGTWTLKGEVSDATDKWAIDATVFQLHGQHYMMWSGWEGDADGQQNIYVAHMSNAWTIDSARTKISSPTFDWEKHGDLPGRHLNVNEGPEFLAHGKKMFVVYSASACWTDFYALGALEASSHADPLEAGSWTKIDHPLLQTDAEAKAFGTGHNGFFKSPNGREDWIIYHANPAAGEGCRNLRSPRMQRFGWDKAGRPDFGKPVELGGAMAKPGRKRRRFLGFIGGD